MSELIRMRHCGFGLVLAWLLVSGVAVAQECPLAAPLTVKDLQSGVVGDTGTVWTIEPDCSFSVARQIGPKVGAPQRRGKLTPEQQRHLHELMAKIEAAAPAAPGAPPQANARKVMFAYGDKTAVLHLAPGGGEPHALRAAAKGDHAARMLDLAAAVKAMTGG
ncbi:MAG TPA: hypothetical protein VFQ82_11970 [Stellaceae bacterium]|nr:hypothetical protein [Stellaceae bacterium]